MGTFGELHAGRLKLYTVERPWLGNTPSESCVPFGEYRLTWHQTTTPVPADYGGHTWYLEGGSVGLSNAPRTRIAIHIANTAADVSGCIGVGFYLGALDSSWAVLQSRHAMEALLDEVGMLGNWLRIDGYRMG